MEDDLNPCWGCNDDTEKKPTAVIKGEVDCENGELAEEVSPYVKCLLLSVPVMGVALAAAFLASLLVLLNVLYIKWRE